MKDSIPPFQGFKKEAFEFLSELSSNNTTEWFNKNRSRYTDFLVQPARSFVVEMGQFFNRLNPAIRTEPKFNETLMRINKDMRFSKGEPYRTYFLIHFGRFKMDSEFYVSFEAGSLDYGLFINNSGENSNFYFKDNLTRYGKEFINVMKNYSIDSNYELYELKKGPVLIDGSIQGRDHLEIMKGLKMILIQKSIQPCDEKIYASDFILEAIRNFSQLYPVYSFAAFPQPLKMIEEFEEHFGSLI